MKRLFISLIAFFPLFIASQNTYQVSFEHDGRTMYGTFTTPSSSGPFPAIIIVPGSGPQDRNGTIIMQGGNIPCLYPELEGDTLKPYKDLAEALTDSGYAVLRYDKIEFTYPPSALGVITFHKLWLPVDSAIDYLKSRDDVDTNKLILIGHSEGSSLIPYVARTRDDIKAMISIGGPRLPLDSILAYQLVHFAKLCGGDTTVAKFQAESILDYFLKVRQGMIIGLPPLFGVQPDVWQEYLDVVDSVSVNYNMSALPSLFLGLELDVNVPLSELDRFEHEVFITDDFWRLPGLVHFMTPSDVPHVSMTLTDTIVYWLRENNLMTGIIHNEISDFSIEVFPNPFNDELTVRIPAFLQATSIALYNLEGKVIFRQPVDSDPLVTISTKNFPEGFLILEVNGKEARKLVKVYKFAR